MARIVKQNWICSTDAGTQLPQVTCLDDGRVLLIADASTDADGAPDAEKIDETGQVQTSLCKKKWRGEGTYVNARTVPYFVLPANWNAVVQVKCVLGDIARLTYRNKSVYAIYADVGGEKGIGEASILAVEALGFDPWVNGKIKNGIPYLKNDGVTYEIVPGSANLEITKNYEDIQYYGKTLFENESVRNETSEPSQYQSAFFGSDAVFNLQQSDSTAVRFISYFAQNYAAVRNEVASWFVRRQLPDGSWIGHEPTATSNACVAHQVTCLKQCALPYPDWNSKTTVNAAINVDVFVGWALEHGWKKVMVRAQLVPGDICVSGPNNDVASLDHVYAFLAFCSEAGDQVSDTDSGTAFVLHNQHFGVGKRSLDGSGIKNIGGWRFALRMPEV
ncbi:MULTISPECIES: glycoside hydrolase family 75 protein [unclassified Pseudomonas]|uniref:glycoside hydrolase family 75 protein n=1 Tax=unclassified Pseudomonas TaxID=196821 RepID=UPI000A1D5EC0|nr:MULTISPECIES: glycoside hydrolase family 75 protein [unclassified Pseudomonas]